MLLPFSTLLLAFVLGVGFDSGKAARDRPEAPRGPSAFAIPTEPPPTTVEVGDPAPNFSYQGHDGRWMRLHHLLDHGPVLLVFGAGEADLRQLESERDVLLGLGVVPVAISDLKVGSARGMSKRMRLRYSLLADHRLVIASLFNVTQVNGVVPSWFVLDRQGRVRDLYRGRLPEQGYVQLCAKALSLPVPGATLPSGGPGSPFRRGRR